VIIFDLESAPLPEDELRKQIPPFDESEVKVGNLKDPEKIAAKIADARESYVADFISRAALSPLTGRVVVIGYHSTDTGKTYLDSGEKNGGGEAELLSNFWLRYQKCRQEKRQLVGHNITGFDVPFIVRRSWMLDIPVPATVFDRGKWLDGSVFVDTMQLWQCGTRDQWVKLDVLSKAFGGGGKPVDEDGQVVTGAQFAELWKTDRKRAEEYLVNDLRMTAEVASRMGLL
jgi:3'-5' exonuclease